MNGLILIMNTGPEVKVRAVEAIIGTAGDPFGGARLWRGPEAHQAARIRAGRHGVSGASDSGWSVDDAVMPAMASALLGAVVRGGLIDPVGHRWAGRRSARGRDVGRRVRQ